MSRQRAIIRRLAVGAVKGDPRAQRLFTEMLTLSEDEAQRPAEQASRLSTMEVVCVSPKARQAEDGAGKDS